MAPDGQAGKAYSETAQTSRTYRAEDSPGNSSSPAKHNHGYYKCTTACPAWGNEKAEYDMVNHPPHYMQGKYEVIDVIEDFQLNYHLGCVVKYIARAGFKGPKIEDLKKAQWYLNREIKRLEGTLE